MEIIKDLNSATIELVALDNRDLLIQYKTGNVYRYLGADYYFDRFKKNQLINDLVREIEDRGFPYCKEKEIKK